MVVADGYVRRGRPGVCSLQSAASKAVARPAWFGKRGQRLTELGSKSKVTKAMDLYVRHGMVCGGRGRLADLGFGC